jgi:hypothetical protein
MEASPWARTIGAANETNNNKTANEVIDCTA